MCSKPLSCAGKVLDRSVIEYDIWLCDYPCSSLLGARAWLFRKACLLPPHLGLTTTLWSIKTCNMFEHVTGEPGGCYAVSTEWTYVDDSQFPPTDLLWSTLGWHIRFSRSSLGHCGMLYHLQASHCIAFLPVTGNTQLASWKGNECVNS